MGKPFLNEERASATVPRWTGPDLCKLATNRNVYSI
jgi:hypothetical protein